LPTCFYELILGQRGNKRSMIRRRRCEGKRARARVMHEPLDESEYRDFWISVDLESGRVAAGAGHDITSGSFVELADTSVIHPKSFALMTGRGSTGSWKTAGAGARRLRGAFQRANGR